MQWKRAYGKKLKTVFFFFVFLTVFMPFYFHYKDWTPTSKDTPVKNIGKILRVSQYLLCETNFQQLHLEPLKNDYIWMSSRRQSFDCFKSQPPADSCSFLHGRYTHSIMCGLYFTVKCIEMTKIETNPRSILMSSSFYLSFQTPSKGRSPEKRS